MYHSVIDWHHDQYEYARSKQLPHPLKGLPYPTDRRRLLMMVRVFLHEFSEFVRAYGDGWPYPADAGADCTDHQLVKFLERLAEDAGQIDEAAQRPETEAEIQRGLEQYLCTLLQHAAWNRNRIQLN